MGGQDGRSRGGAVNWFALARSSSRACLTLTVFVISASNAACSRQTATAPPDASTLLQSIAAVDPGKYPSVQEIRHWSNPYLVIRPNEVGLLTSVTANEEQILKPEEVLNALARFPGAAWPYGRVVAILVDEKPTSSEQDKIALRRSRGIVEGDLENAHVAIRWIPTS